MQEYLLRFLSLTTKPFIHTKRNGAQVILSILCAVPSKLFVNTPLLYGKVPNVGLQYILDNRKKDMRDRVS